MRAQPEQSFDQSFDQFVVLVLLVVGEWCENTEDPTRQTYGPQMREKVRALAERWETASEMKWAMAPGDPDRK